MISVKKNHANLILMALSPCIKGNIFCLKNDNDLAFETKSL
jgi:hypothetical protein